MSTKRNPADPSPLVVMQMVNFRAPSRLVEDFKEVVEREERTISQALRHYMAERVDQAREAA